MFDKPPLADETLIACLQREYGLLVTTIEFLPLGYDAYAAVYRAKTTDQDYFVKIKWSAVNEIHLAVPHYLKSQGMAQVIAPIPTLAQQLHCRIDEFSLILYPFVAGNDAWESGLTDSQWRDLGVFLKKLHTTPLTPHFLAQVAQETFIPAPQSSAIVHQLQAGNYADDPPPIAQELNAFWQTKKQFIRILLEQTTQLSQRLQAKSHNFVLCHADIHHGNLLLTASGSVFVVDWDQPILAPVERDLLFVVVGDFVRDVRFENLFFEGYGNYTVDLETLAYYRCARLIEDVGEFAKQALSPTASAATQQNALDWVMKLLATGSSGETAQGLAQTMLQGNQT